ncbi:hypothetical protein M3Y99_01185400 [Aphelenchoides fujianensis]|nr:hypothetical protein M3Y99_01185400 [Aphelenchoides fujianensis]
MIQRLVLLLLLLLRSFGEALYCWEGTNCELDGSCDQCEGVACLRVVRPPRTSYYAAHYAETTPHSLLGNVRTLMRGDNADFHAPTAQVALTCLPDDTRSFELEPEGCRTNQLSRLRTCVCYWEYCNAGDTRGANGLVSFAPLLLPLLPRAFRFA